MTPKRRDLRLADHARSGRAAPHARSAGRRRRHPSGAWRRPRTGSTSTGSTACASRPAASPICRRDHLDYHPTVEAYLAAKLRLFERAGRADGGGAVIDGRSRARRARSSRRRGSAGCALITVGRNGDGIRLVDSAIDGFAQTSQRRACAASAIPRAPAAGRRVPGRERAGRGRARDRHRRRPPARVRRRSKALEGAKGRLELVGDRNGAPIFVDYAHKPDALAKALEALRPYVQAPAVVVFGCGGDRDAGKRAADGRDRGREGRPRHRHRRQSAQRESGRDPRRDPGGGAGRDAEIGDRGEAIRRAVASSSPATCCWSPARAMKPARSSATGRCRSAITRRSRRRFGRRRHERAPAVDRRGDGAAMARRAAAARCRPTSPAFPSTAARSRRAKPSSPSRAMPRRARFRRGRARRPARGLAVVARDKRAARCRATRRCSSSPDVLAALSELGARRARALAARIVARHRLGRQDRHQGGAAARACRADGETHASAASYNNHWGVPLSLARMPGERALRACSRSA